MNFDRGPDLGQHGDTPMGFFSGRKSARSKLASAPKLGACKVVRGRGGLRKLCYTGQGLTGWQFKKGPVR